MEWWGRMDEWVARSASSCRFSVPRRRVASLFTSLLHCVRCPFRIPGFVLRVSRETGLRVQGISEKTARRSGVRREHLGVRWRVTGCPLTTGW